MTPFQLAAAIDGWMTAHGGEPVPEAPTDDEFDELLKDDARREMGLTTDAE